MLLADVFIHQGRVPDFTPTETMNRTNDREQFEKLVSETTGFRSSRVITTAVSLDLFESLSRSSYTALNSVAGDGMDSDALRRVCDALVSLDLLEKEDQKYRCTERAERFLSGRGPYDVRPIFRVYHRMYNMWTHLENAVNEGQTIELEETAKEDWAPDFIAAMEARAIFEKEDIAEVVAPFLEGGRILDLGGGSGVYSRAILEACPEATGTIMELPRVADESKKYIRSDQLQERMNVEEKDLLETDDYGSGYDVVFLSALLHLFGPETNQRIMRKTARALDHGGVVVLRDYVFDEERSGPAGAAMFDLHMLLETEEGRVYTENAYREWMEEAGLTFDRIVDLNDSSKLLLGRKAS